MKKRILTAVAIIAVVALSLFLAACDGEVLFKVTSDYDSAQGTVTVTDADGKAKSEFVAGASVVVTVKANEGYEIDGFTVNGVDTELNNGIHAFYISANTVVKATFKKSNDDDDDDDDGGDDKTPEELFAAAFDSVKTTFKVTGSYTYREEGQEAHINRITTVFGAGAVNIVETDNDTGAILHDDVYVDVDGYLAQPYHTVDNKIEYLYPEVRELYDDYDNPFKKLTPADFAKTEIENVFELTAEDKFTATATAITGWYEGIASFTVTIGDGKVTNINISTKRIVVGSTSYTSVYSFTVSEWGTAEVYEDAIAPYKTTEAHTALKNALKAASEAQSYTATVSENGLTEQDEDLEYDIYVTESAIYIDCEGWREGYVEKNMRPDDEDGTRVYHFRFGTADDGEELDGKLIIGDAVDYQTVADMCASFGGFAPEIFQNDGEVYTLQYDCAGLAKDVLVNFADGADNIRLYSLFAENFVQITLKDGALYRIELYYNIYDDAIIKRTITYSAWDETTMPIDFDDYVRESVFDDYVGTYTDGTIVVKVTTSGITINNRPFEITSYSTLYQEFTGVYNGQECSVLYMSAKQLAVLIGTNSYIVTNIDIPAVTIPAAYNGVWSDGDNSVTVAYNKVMFGSNMLKVLSYDEDEGLVALRGNVTYRMKMGALQDETVLSVRTISSNISSNTYTMQKVENGFIIPQTFVGTYADFRDFVDYKVVVTLNGVTVKFDSAQYVATDVSVGNDATKGTVINCRVNGVDYVIAKQQYTDGINFAGGTVDVNLSKTEDDDPATPPVVSVDIPQTFYGKYQYFNAAAHEYYYLSIGDDGIFACIDMSSNEYQAEILEFDEEDDFMIVVSINGKTFYLFGSVDNTNDDGKYNIITLMNDKEGEGAVEVKLLRIGYKPENPDEQPPAFDIPVNFIGTYEGTGSDGTIYELTITEIEMTLKVGDNEPVNVAIKNYETTDSRTRFTVVIPNVSFIYVSYMGNLSEQGEKHIDKLFFSGGDVANVTLNRVTATENDNNQ